jgi:hypothetical protein
MLSSHGMAPPPAALRDNNSPQGGGGEEEEEEEDKQVYKDIKSFKSIGKQICYHRKPIGCEIKC